MTCPICGHETYWPVAYNRDTTVDSWRKEAGDLAPYDWRLCRGCSNAYPSKQPDLRVLARMWAVNRTANDANTDAATVAYRRFISRSGAERSYRLFAPLTGTNVGRFLDIACGLGETVRIFADYGWDAEGIDADPSTEPFHRELGIRTRIGQLEDIEIGSNYDVIHVAHAIYFITDPMKFLRTVRERLATGGLFCIVLADFMSNSRSRSSVLCPQFLPDGVVHAICAGIGRVRDHFQSPRKGQYFPGRTSSCGSRETIGLALRNMAPAPHENLALRPAGPTRHCPRPRHQGFFRRA